MREEYIARLYDFEKVVPQLFNHRFRVEPMPPLALKEVIGGSCDAFGISFADREETVKGIVTNNRDEQGLIGLPYLQVYLDRLYREAEKRSEVSEEKGGILFTPDLVERVGKISDVMAAFLDEQTKGVQKNLEGKHREVPDEFVWQVLNCFVTVEGTNLPLEKEVLFGRLDAAEGILNDCLAGLESSRILRLSENQKTYEIAHDALALRIDDKRSVEEKTLLKVERLVKDRFVAYGDTASLLAKGELNYIEPYEKKLESRLEAEEIDFIAKSRKHTSKRRRNFVIGTTCIVVILLLFAVFAGWQWKVAEEKTKEAIANQQIAEEQKRIAEKKIKEALESKELANKKTEEAVASQKFAEEQKKIAEKKTKEAIVSKELAEEKTKEAIASKKLADKKTGEAKVSLEYSGQQKRIAEKKEKEANARRLAVIAETVVEWNPNLALRIAEKAWRLHKNQAVTDTIYKIYRENNFYKIAATHRESITSVAFSPDGKTILTGSKDKTARLWDLQGKKLHEFKGHKDYVSSVAFSLDGKTILTGSRDATARLWDLQGNTLHEFKGHIGGVTSVAFSPDGRTILTSSKDNTARLWDMQGNAIQEFKGHTEEITSVAFAPDGKTILTGSKDKTARLWDLRGDTLQKFKRHISGVTSVAFAP
ncbi:MAG: hypothetical protein KAW12_21330, partial [Candidatus Aminicenantes bacterium]|nr:hypothetical protein [Candidatus Aminicenantes bacterium]